jgi:phosphoribosylformimino-5-aminoimidazole carboxamide ribotide isomerase
MKIIAAIDLMQGKVVRLTRGDPNLKVVYSSEPLMVAELWEREGADMLHIVDLDSTLAISNNKDIIKKICTRVSIPVQVAGGLRDTNIIKEMLEYSNSVVIGTLAYNDKDLFAKLLNIYGNDRIVVAVDHVNGKVMVHGWKNAAGMSVLDAVKHFRSIGAKRFLLTSIDRDGTMQGVDTDTLKDVLTISGIEVIASGGVASINDILALKELGVYGVILGKALYENRISIGDVKRVLKKKIK